MPDWPTCAIYQASHGTELIHGRPGTAQASKIRVNTEFVISIF
jgi:hypothetical protein